MARKLRIQYPGAIYHAMSRGDHQERIFSDDTDRQQFLSTLEQCCQKTAWQVHAFCLMSNHFHLVVETPQGNLVAGRKWFLGVYTRRFNVRHKVFGHLFSGRYKALPVDGSQSGYLKSVCDYVQLNPERAGLLRPGQPLQTYLWSSYPLSEDHLMAWRKGHPFKIELAAKLRTETTVTLSWIAQRLAMGTRGHLAHLLYVHQHCPTEDGPAEQPGLEI